MSDVLKMVRPFSSVDDAIWRQVEIDVAAHGLTGAAGNIVRAAVQKAAAEVTKGSRSEAGRRAANARWGKTGGGSDSEDKGGKKGGGGDNSGDKGGSPGAAPQSTKEFSDVGLRYEIDRVDSEIQRLDSRDPKHRKLGYELRDLMGEAMDRGWVNDDGTFNDSATALTGGKRRGG